MEQNKTLPICDWYELDDNNEIPEGFGFRVVGGKKVYKHVDFMWKRSSTKEFCLSDDWLANKARWFEPGTPVELVKLQESANA